MHSITTHSQYKAVPLSQTADLDAGSRYQGNISVASRNPVWVVKRTTASLQSGKPHEPRTHPCCSPKTNRSKTAFVFTLHTSIPQAVETKHHINEENHKHVACFVEVCILHTKYALVIATIMVNFGCELMGDASSRWRKTACGDFWPNVKKCVALNQLFLKTHAMFSHAKSTTQQHRITHDRCYSLQIP